MTFSSNDELQQMIMLLHNELEVYKKLEIEREKVEFEDELGDRTEARLSEKLASRWRGLVKKLMIQQQFDEISHLQEIKKCQRLENDLHQSRAENENLQLQMRKLENENENAKIQIQEISKKLKKFELCIVQLEKEFEWKASLLDKKMSYHSDRFDMINHLLIITNQKLHQCRNENSVLESEIKTLHSDRKKLLQELVLSNQTKSILKE